MNKKARDLSILFSALVMVFGSMLTGCIITGPGSLVTGSGNLATREMDISDFDRINISHTFQVEITRSDIFRVSVTADDNLDEYLEVEKSGSTLNLGLKDNHSYTNATLQAVVSLPDIYRLELSGASRADISGFTFSHTANFQLSGASNLELANFEAGDASFNISGASRLSGALEIPEADMVISGASTVELSGSAEEIEINASGASRVNLIDFPAVDADVNLSGASSARMAVSGTLDAELSGASRLTYAGSPSLGDIDVSGGSTVQAE